jgi:outer membrane protein assembly factor BamB
MVVDGMIYVQGSGGEIACLNAATGEVVWRNELGKHYEVERFRAGRASPQIDGDRLIVVIGGKPNACVLALDRRTGREIWKAMDEPPSNSTPIIVPGGGTRQLIVWTDRSVTSLDPETGATFWREAMTTSNNDDIATPVSAGDRLLISGLMFKLAAEKPEATILWPVNLGVSKRVLSNTSTPWMNGDFIYSATSQGELVCLDARTGERVWATDKVTARKTGPSIHITPNGDAAFLFTDEGNLIRARLTPTGYEELSRTHLIDPVYLFAGHKLVWSPPAYANRCIFVRSESELIRASLVAE